LIRNSASIRRFGGRQDVGGAALLIFTRGGLILWALSGGKGSPVDALIRNCLLEERSGADGPGFTQDGKRALKWAFHNGLGLVVLAVYNARGDPESDGNGDGDGSKQDASDGVSGEKEEKEDGQAFDLSFFSNLRTRFTHSNKNNTNTNKPTNKDVNKRKNPRDWNNNWHSDMKLDFSDPADARKRTDQARVNQGQSKIDVAETVEDGPRNQGMVLLSVPEHCRWQQRNQKV